MTEHNDEVAIKGVATVKGAAAILRGPQSWAYIYVALGFAIATEGGMLTLASPPLLFPLSLLVFVLVAAVTAWLFLFNGRFQDRLLALKGNYENEAR